MLLGPATGRVLDHTGTEVSTFEFESGWAIPSDWDYQDTLALTNAPTQLEVALPGPGRYTFKLDEFAVSHNPCGTCERGLSGSSVTQDIEDATVVELSGGDLAWES